jgi:transaldolase
MAASFRTADQVRALAGIDAITISPVLLQQLEESTDALPYQLWPSMGGAIDPLIDLSSHSYHVFEQMHGGDAMAVEQLAKGIEGFSNDSVKLEALLAEKLGIK